MMPLPISPAIVEIGGTYVSRKPVFPSIVKKSVMSVSGILMLLFLAAHMIGNTTIFAGGRYLAAYAEHLHALGFFVYIFEVGLIVLFGVHIVFALWVTWENWRARPVRYIVSRSSNERSLSSKLVFYTGVYTLIFLVIHLLNFRLATGGDLGKLVPIVDRVLSNPGWAVFYFVSMVIVALHVAHGAWSAFQTLGFGMSNTRFVRLSRGAGLLFSLAVGVVFGLMPFAVWFLGRLR